MYFAWFKKHNHLYKNVELDSNLIDDFIENSIASSKDFEKNTKVDDEIYQSDEKEDQMPEDSTEICFKQTTSLDPHKPITSEENNWMHDQTSMFLNKYCENPNIPTVAKQGCRNYC